MKKTLKLGFERQPYYILNFFLSIFHLVRLNQPAFRKSASYLPWKWSKSLWVYGGWLTLST